MTMARLKQSMWRWLLGLALICGTVNPAKANFVNNSCTAKVNGLPWNYTEIPANPPEGLVIARRVVILDVTYQKTGNVMDELMIGGYWHAFGRFNSIYNTTSISGLPGVGIRFASLRSPQRFFSEQLGMDSATNIGPDENSGHYQDYYLMELVITNALTFKGGSGTQVNGLPVFVASSRFTYRNPGLAPICIAAQTIPQGEVLTIGGDSLKPIPPPATPTCTAATQNLNFTVDLPPITPLSLANIGNLSGGTATSLVLTECGANATPYVTFTDSNDRNNRTTSLTPSADSTASGVGIQVMSGNSPIRLGAQNTNVSANNIGQFLMGISTSEGGTLSLPLQIYYIRTGTMKPGVLKAGAIVTIVYP